MLIRLWDTVLRVLEHDLPAVLFLAVGLGVFADAIGRYAFNHPLAGMAEVVMVAFVWAVFLAAAGETRRDEHVAIDVLTVRLPPRARAITQVVAYLITLVTLTSLLWLSIDYLMNTRFTSLTYTGLSRSYVYLALPTTLALMVGHVSALIVEPLKGAYTGVYAPVDRAALTSLSISDLV